MKIQLSETESGYLCEAMNIAEMYCRMDGLQLQLTDATASGIDKLYTMRETDQTEVDLTEAEIAGIKQLAWAMRRKDEAFRTVMPVAFWAKLNGKLSNYLPIPTPDFVCKRG